MSVLRDLATFVTGASVTSLPETERATRETLALPIYPELSWEAQIYVVDAIEEFFTAAAKT